MASVMETMHLRACGHMTVGGSISIFYTQAVATKKKDGFWLVGVGHGKPWIIKAPQAAQVGHAVNLPFAMSCSHHDMYSSSGSKQASSMQVIARLATEPRTDQKLNKPSMRKR